MQMFKTLAAALATTACLTVVSADAAPSETVNVAIFKNPSGLSVCVDGGACFPVRVAGSADWARALVLPRIVCFTADPDHCLVEDTTASAPRHSSLEDEKMKTQEHGGQIESVPCATLPQGWICGGGQHY